MFTVHACCLQMVGLGLEDDWPTIQELSSNSSDLMDTADDLLMSPQESSYPNVGDEDFEDPGMFL